ncbi:MAG: fibronectin type III domain-containing protein [Usitatibacteraceae bacterium]
MFRNVRTRVILAGLLLTLSAAAHSAFHIVQINEVYSNASGSVQFIEITMLAAGQNFFAGQSISSSQGGATNVATFTNNLANGSTGDKVLIGTAGYAALPGVPAPDLIVPNGFVFTSNVTLNFAGADLVSLTAVPTDGTLSVDRNGVTATNSPTNNARDSGTVVLSNPPAVPGAPLIGTATPGNGQASIAFTPGSAGSTATTSYTATCTSTGQQTRTGTAAGSPITVTLTNGILYSCSVTASNSVGTSSPSGAVNVTATAPVTTPGAPTISSITPGNTLATINFTPPASDGGGAIDNYIANCSGAVSSGPSSPIVVSGLSNGTTYSCTVTAHNSAGNGPASAAVNVTPALPGTLPGAPTITSAVPGNAQATISFTAPVDGGNPISSYRVNCAPQGVATGSASPIVVGGLSNGTTYNCSVTATNGVGPGPASAPVNVTPFTLPGAPTIGAATPGNTTASIAFTPPASNGGSAITGYTATCNPGAISAASAVSPININGLTNGTAYTCTITASNAAGPSAASGAVIVVPATVPDAPLIGVPIAGDARASVAFTPPVSNGGAAISSFTATCGGLSATGLASPISVTGLANDVAVTCSVVAANAIGNSIASATASVTPSASAPLTPIAVLARKVHGATGTYDIPIDTTPPLAGAISVEPRAIGSGHTLVFQFNVPVATTGTLTIAPVGTGTAAVAGTDVVVTLSAMPDNQRTTISLAGVNGTAVNVSASLGFLVGDVNTTRSVNSSDISGVKARSGQTTTSLNFRFDVNATGAINSSDISAVKARSGLVLP